MAPAKNKKRDLIIEKAREAFQRYGLRKTTMEDIAKGCGLRKASLYYYFRSKEAIIAEMMRRVGSDLCRRTRSRVAAAETVQEAFRAFFAPGDPQENKEALLLMDMAREDLFGLLPLAEEAMQEAEDDMRRTLEEILLRGAREGVFQVPAPRETAAVLFNVWGAVRLSIGLEGIDTAPAKLNDIQTLMALVERGLSASE